ncbi:hypothetical protein ES705_35085 [subsurface metagenome]
MGKVVVIGASLHPLRYSYQAVKNLLERGYDVVPVGIRNGQIGNAVINTERAPIEDVDIILLYISKEKQIEYYDYILQLKPGVLLFNPGTENPELDKICSEHGIEVIYDCALILIESDELNST